MPLGTYDFGGVIGIKNTGATDTILQRLDPVTNLDDGASQTINLKMVALSLQSQNEINWGAIAPGGNANEFVKTVNLVDTGSTMTIKNGVPSLDPLAEGGTFDSVLQFRFQLQGVISGVVLSNAISVVMNQSGSTWGHIPSTNNPIPILIDGVNNHLNGSNHVNDFFTGTAQHYPLPSHFHETADINMVPEPTSMFAIGLACMAAGGGFARRRRLQQAT